MKYACYHIAVTFLLLSTSLFAQEQLLPLRHNPAVAKSSLPDATLRTPLSLPFADDFSYLTAIPSNDLWTDRQAFVNTTFALHPPSIGVATLDGLNEFGNPYDSLAYNQNSIGGADTLTSQPILLGALSPASNVYLSFLFEPGGLADKPNDSLFNSFNFGKTFGDSLIVEFKDVNGNWQHVWAIDGLPGNGLSHDRFYHEIFKVDDSSFFHDDFQFRFRNIASRIGQYDCWHIDYVKLDDGRAPSDTLLNDVAIQYMPTSILKNYYQMPWNQFEGFQSTEKSSLVSLTVLNSFNAGKNTSARMRADETTTGTFIYESGILSDNVDPSESKIYQFSSFDIPNFSGDSVVIATSFAVSATGGSGVNTKNDSVTRNHIFYNELSYDDGTPEAVYRLLGSPASVALRYYVNVPDTLRGVKIMFAHTDVNMSNTLFNLMVWSAVEEETNNADTLLRDEFLFPEFSNERNGFAFYRLSRPIPVTDTFYIGWFQVSLETDLKLDVSFDKNDTASQHLLYNVAGAWTPSELAGAVMMRPVLGDAIPYQVGVPPIAEQEELSIFPNPADKMLHVVGPSVSRLYEVVDYSGRCLITERSSSTIDISKLTAGFYLLRITDLQSGRVSIHKFIKASY